MHKSNFRRILVLITCAALMFAMVSGVFVFDAAATERNGYSDNKLIPGGVPFGVKFSTEGVVVIGFYELEGLSSSQNPAYVAGLRPKDVIIKINGKQLTDCAELVKMVEECEGRALELTYLRGKNENTAKLVPAYSGAERRYKSGIWVKDHGAGIGTVTYIVPGSGEFGGLGHGICDGETGELIKLNSGVVMNVKINAVKKGVAGDPGEIKGSFLSDKTGTLRSNTECGVFGRLDHIPKNLGQAIPIALRNEVKCGEAKIISTLSDGKREEYKIEISSVNRDAKGSKSFIIKITDDRLINVSGGIVQGMSGSPIIQNGKLVGAVTHVMINDPTTGYGIFIENMLNAANIPMAKAS